MPTPYGWLADAENVGLEFLPDVHPGDRLVNLMFLLGCPFDSKCLRQGVRWSDHLSATGA